MFNGKSAMKHLQIRLFESQRIIPVEVGNGLASSLRQFIGDHFSGYGLFVITDQRVQALHGETLGEISAGWPGPARVVSIPPGEQEKSIPRWQWLVSQLLTAGAGRDSLLVAAGGGVIGDLAGFVAATLNRGVPYLHLPTTLLAQVDASIGGKVGINHPLGKNLIGSFYQPVAIFTDVRFLRTLPDIEFASGLGEVFKYAFALDGRLLDFLEQEKKAIMNREPEALEELVGWCVQLKIEVVEKDEKEAGLRSLLNFGHTVAHALERLSEYRLHHGLAVMAGMQVAMVLSHQKFQYPLASLERFRQLMADYRIPVVSLAVFTADQVWEALQSDKKARGGQPRFTLLDANHQPSLFVAVTEEEFTHAFQQVQAVCESASGV